MLYGDADYLYLQSGSGFDCIANLASGFHALYLAHFFMLQEGSLILLILIRRTVCDIWVF